MTEQQAPAAAVAAAVSAFDDSVAAWATDVRKQLIDRGVTRLEVLFVVATDKGTSLGTATPDPDRMKVKAMLQAALDMVDSAPVVSDRKVPRSGGAS